MATAAVKTCEVIGREMVTAALLVPPMIDCDEEKHPLKSIATGMHDCTFLVLTKH